MNHDKPLIKVTEACYDEIRRKILEQGYPIGTIEDYPSRRRIDMGAWIIETRARQRSLNPLRRAILKSRKEK